MIFHRFYVRPGDQNLRKIDMVSVTSATPALS